MVRHNASRILMPLLIHCGILSCPYVPKRSPAGSGDENPRFPFSNRENVITKIRLVQFVFFWSDVEHNEFASDEENHYHGLLRPDGLPGP
jgi:hypothetical protein